MSTNEEMSTSQVTAEASPSFTGSAVPLLTPVIVTLENNRTVIQIADPNHHTYTISPGAVIANFAALTPNQAKIVKPMPMEPLFLIGQLPEETPQMKNQLFSEPTCNENHKLTPPPDTCTDPDTLNSLKRRMYDGTVKIRAQKTLDLSISNEQQQTFFPRFNCENSQLSHNKKQQLEQILLKYEQKFSRHPQTNALTVNLTLS